MNTIQYQLKKYCELHWWNCRKKTLSFKGELKDLLIEQKITFSKRKSNVEGLYVFHFKNPYGISFKSRGLISDFSHLAKQFIQMELVRMGDKSQLYVEESCRPTVNVNY